MTLGRYSEVEVTLKRETNKPIRQESTDMEERNRVKSPDFDW